MKRENYITWDELFMGIAELASKRSKDPRTQNGCCIIDAKNRVVSISYNGFARGCSDDEFSWDRQEKHKYVIHAEINAVLNATKPLDGCILYIYSERGYYPCTECGKVIAQSGIKEVVLKYIGNEPDMREEYNGEAVKKMFAASGVSIRVLETRN